MQSLHWFRDPLLLAAALVAAQFWLPTMQAPGRGRAHSRHLQAHPSSVSAARRIVRDTLTEAERDDLIEAAQLLVSEVVTNALVHAGTEIDFRASIDTDGLRVEVTDGSTQHPVPRNYGAMAGTGRGLRLLEQLVDRWGTLAHEDGKTVWFELSSGVDLDHVQIVADAGEVEAFAGPARDDTVEVVLVNVPLLLHAAWLQHAEELLREYLLASLDADDATETLEMHAAASGAMALLHEHMPAPDVGENPSAVMASAVEPQVSAERLQLALPRGAVSQFRVLNETLEAARAAVDSGVFLTPPIQPELRALRRWLCGQVAAAESGEHPVPWSYDADSAPPPRVAPISWDDEVVTAADDAVIAADDTDQIIAVSRPACDLLGYDEPGQLLGRRLVALIPHRYHQAHLAGFTLHLLNGRSPLLGRTVNVPVLRRDGTEISADLVVTTHQMPGGRRLFIAEVRPQGVA